MHDACCIFFASMQFRFLVQSRNYGLNAALQLTLQYCFQCQMYARRVQAGG